MARRQPLTQRPVRGRVAFILLVALAASSASAQVAVQASSASYQIPRQTIDTGGARMASTSFTLTGTIGQPDAGPRMTSATFRLQGGFHRAGESTSQPDRIFRDRFEFP